MPDLSHLLRNYTVCFPAASRHHKKLAEYAIAGLGNQVQLLGLWRFRLRPAIFTRVVSAISEELRFHTKTDTGVYDTGHGIADSLLLRSPDDLVAIALYSTAIVRTARSGSNFEAELAWDPAHPVIGAWNGIPFRKGKPRLRSLPLGREQVLEFDRGKLRFPQTLFQQPRVKIGWELSVDASQLPILEMRIQGAPVARLHFPKGSATADQRRAAFDLLDPSFRWLMKELGALRREAHHPRTTNDFDAAILHFHVGLPWKAVAEKLCRINHEHNVDCEAKCQQAAKRYYKVSKNRVTPPR